MTQEQRDKISLVGQIYTPSFPIEFQELFSGRSEELRSVVQIISQKGKQLIIYGDRGVGKTSFANIVKLIFENPNSKL
jgi:replication-associated recombination protein RarA